MAGKGEKIERMRSGSIETIEEILKKKRGKIEGKGENAGRRRKSRTKE